MSGWLYEGVAANLKPHGMTVEQYIGEMRAQGAGWSEIQGHMRDDDLVPWGRLLSPATVKAWGTRCAS